MDLENILHYISELYEEELEIVFYNYKFGIYDDFIEELTQEDLKGFNNGK